jgi:methylated-DNA-protein-cysteine methyltransferase-like protein
VERSQATAKWPPPQDTPTITSRLLKTMIPGELPWHRVLGAGGQIKLPGSAAAEQRLRLRMEGVMFVSKRVDFKLHQHVYELE